MISEHSPVDEAKWELGRAPCCGLGVTGVSVHRSPGKSIHRKKGVHASMGGKAAGRWRAGGRLQKTNLLALCRFWQP